ncbi:MAG: MFS transporter, partial [Eubacteriales bacterium]|nr:MFS transporter [Eubacteriales bacterium]
VLLWFGSFIAFLGLLLLGLGCAPIYPCMIHATPLRFGKEQSQALIGVQMASAYTGISLMPPLFGGVSKLLGLGILPVYLLLIIGAMVYIHRRLIKNILK